MNDVKQCLLTRIINKVTSLAALRSKCRYKIKLKISKCNHQGKLSEDSHQHEGRASQFVHCIEVKTEPSFANPE